MRYTIQQASRDFHLGILKGFNFVQVPMLNGWSVQFESNLGMLGNPYLTGSRSDDPRIFNTLNSALSTVRSVGFKADFFGFRQTNHNCPISKK